MLWLILQCNDPLPLISLGPQHWRHSDFVFYYMSPVIGSKVYNQCKRAHNIQISMKSPDTTRRGDSNTGKQWDFKW
jgi:hypothetical protein